ncbi:MAG: Outer rane autotransporter barrel [Hyphomicrobiales bacterium]|nr:Outer rane autotransporter barrel [Hyphomicrobiales bacterium]
MIRDRRTTERIERHIALAWKGFSMRAPIRAAAVLMRISALMLTSLSAQAQSLDSFAVLAGSTITNTGPSVIGGNVGLSPGSAVTGFPPATITPPFAVYQNNEVALRAQNDLATAYGVLAGRPATADLTGLDLGGRTLTPGVYSFNSASQLTGTLTLDAKGNPNAVFIFNVGSALTTATNSAVQLINGAQGANVYFRVGSSATLGAATTFAGQILALTSITLVTGASIDCGAALARNGAVTLDTNRISVCALAAATYGSALSSTATGNDRAVSAAIDKYVASGGILPLAFQVVPDALSPAEFAAATAQLAGEAGAAVAPTGIEATNAFMSRLFDAAYEDDVAVAPAAVVPDRREGLGSNTVRALGYGPSLFGPAAGSPFGTMDRIAPRVAPEQRRWRMWGAGYGGQSNIAGDAGQGSHDLTTRTLGFAAGAETRVTPDTKLGFAVGGGATRFGVADGLGGGRSEMFHAALYSRTDFGSAYLTSAVAYAWHDVSTTRNVTIAGNERLTAAFSANNFAGQVEAGYRLEWLTPYASLGVQTFAIPSYREQGVNGPSIFALDYDARTTTSTRSQLGLRIDQTVAALNEMTLRLRARAAWMHDFSPSAQAVASFQALSGSAFSVAGAPGAHNALLLSAGPEIRVAKGLAVTASFDTQLSRGVRAYGGTGRIQYTW